MRTCLKFSKIYQKEGTFMTKQKIPRNEDLSNTKTIIETPNDPGTDIASHDGTNTDITATAGAT